MYNNDEGTSNPRGDVIMTWDSSTGGVEAVSPTNPLPTTVVGGGGSSTPGTTAVVTGVAASAAVVTLKASNSSRKELTIKNSSTSTGILYFKYGTSAAINSGNYTDSLAPGDSAYIDKYSGSVTGIWDSATAGFANVTEVS